MAMHRFVIQFVILLVLMVSCATRRTILPEINEPPRTTLDLKAPVLVGVLDARTSKEQSEEVTSSLREGLSHTYGKTLEWGNYFSQVPKGRVAVIIRIKANEADFGSRIISFQSIQNSFTTAIVQATGGWESVVATASVHQTIFGTTFSAEGWWIGTAWLEVEIVDNRQESCKRVSIPLVSEHKESNMWGYKSGDAAVRMAWGTVSQQLIQVFDTALMTLRDQGY